MASPVMSAQSMESMESAGVQRSNVETKYKLPYFQHAYTKHPRHPMTAQYTDEAHSFLASHGVDKQLGAEMWSAYVSARSPEIVGYFFSHAEPCEFMWLSRFMAFVIATDTKMDEGEYSDNPEKSLATVLGTTLVLLWNNPDDERLLKHMQLLHDCVAHEESQALMKAFQENLVHAKNKSRNLRDIGMPPLASAFRELWVEYCEAVPAEFVLREANTIQDFIMGCVMEAKNRKSGYQIRTVEEYSAIRRWTAGVLPFIIYSDMLIARSLKVPHIPNSIFYGSEMQTLLSSVNDILGWHNDLYSFHKEVLLAEDAHNLVKVVCEERNCSSYTEAGQIVQRLIQDKIADMERAYEQLKKTAPPEYHPAIDRYITTCRDAISGSHQWHSSSERYSGSSI